MCPDGGLVSITMIIPWIRSTKDGGRNPGGYGKARQLKKQLPGLFTHSYKKLPRNGFHTVSQQLLGAKHFHAAFAVFITAEDLPPHRLFEIRTSRIVYRATRISQ